MSELPLTVPRDHTISDHGFMSCPNRGPQRDMHFQTEDIPFVSFCPWCGESVRIEVGSE